MFSFINRASAGRHRREHPSSKATRYTALVLAAVLAMFVVPASQATDSGARPMPDQFTPLAASVLAEPQPVHGADGKIHLAYELLVINPTPLSVTVERLEALDAGRPARVLGDLAGPDLEAVMSSVAGVPGRTLGEAQVYRVLLDLQLNPTAKLPRSLVHRLTVMLDPPQELFPATFLAARTKVSRERAVVLGPPLQGGNWVQVNGCCGPTGHRMAVSPVNGGLYAAQRFAVDIAQLDAEDRFFAGPPDEVTSFPSYGKPVLSVAAGVVISTRNDLPDQIPFQPTPVESAPGALGNYVVVGIGDGRYAMYAHFKPGSVLVSAGDRVREGQLLGRVGNSGNSDFPHLHFQIMSSASPLGSDGLPFVLRSFDSPGSIPPFDQIDVTQPVPILPELGGHYERRIPMERQVVDYPDVRK